MEYTKINKNLQYLESNKLPSYIPIADPPRYEFMLTQLQYNESIGIMRRALKSESWGTLYIEASRVLMYLEFLGKATKDEFALVQLRKLYATTFYIYRDSKKLYDQVQ